MSGPVCVPRSTKRRTKAEIARIESQIFEALKADRPMTVRQLFYRLVSRVAIEKTEREYKGTIVRLALRLRESDMVPWGWIADATRWMRKPDTFTGLSQFLEDQQTMYRRDIWRDQEAYVEVWCEKDALAGVLYAETARWGVPLMISRGYSSATFLHSAAATIAEQGKPAYLYHFGDYDPTGRDIARAIERRLREFAPKAEIHFQIAAVTPEQIEEYGLQTRPTKKSDTRARRFKGESVDVDAIEPKELRRLCRQCIERHIDANRLQKTKLIEAAEQERLDEFIYSFREAS